MQQEYKNELASAKAKVRRTEKYMHRHGTHQAVHAWEKALREVEAVRNR